MDRDEDLTHSSSKKCTWTYNETRTPNTTHTSSETPLNLRSQTWSNTSRYSSVLYRDTSTCLKFMHMQTFEYACCYSLFYHTWLITCWWPSVYLCRLFRPHELILSFGVPRSSLKNPYLLLYTVFNPILACTREFWPQTLVHRDVCINPNIFGFFLHVCPNHLTLVLP